MRLLTLALLALLLAPQDTQTAWQPEPRFRVGYRLLRVPWDGQPGATELAIDVWYPTADEPREHEYPVRRGLTTQAAVDAAPLTTEGRFPLVVYSHGFGGSGLAAPYLTERLAARGFVVASPDYMDSFIASRSDREVQMGLRQGAAYIRAAQALSESFQAGTYDREEFAYRPRTASKAIDVMLAEDSPLRAVIDADRIGAVGHSFGAYTTMMVAGVDDRFRDARVRAACAHSGPVGEVYRDEEIGRIAIPLMIQFGEHEEERGKLEGCQRQYDAAHAPRFLLAVADATHMTFSQPRGSQTVADAWTDPKVAAIAETTIAFFEGFLKGDAAARAFLDRSGDARFSLERHEFP